MAVCGVLASLPALHLSACVRACLGPRVHACTCVQCNSAPCDMLGWEPGGFRMPVLLCYVPQDWRSWWVHIPSWDAGAL